MSAPGRSQALIPEPHGGEGNPLSAPGRSQAPMPEPLGGEGTPVRAAAQPGFARYLAPVRLEEALEAMARPGGATVLAGGTDLMLQLGIGRVRPAATLLNIRHVEGLEAIGDEGGELVVGTLVPVSTLLADPRVALHAPLLVLAARRFASEQIRNAATVGGNVCNASPAGDLATPLLALGAAVTLARLDGGMVRTRRLPVDGFFTGPGRTQRAADELLLALHVPKAPAGAVQRFYKGGTREGLDISSISIALAARRGDGGALHEVRLALGAVAPTLMRSPGAERLLEGVVPSAERCAAAARAAADDARPIDDVRASAWYRRELLRNMTERMLADVCA